MIASLHMQPTAAIAASVLQQVALAMTRINELWIIAEQELGATPPRSLRDVRPPYGQPLAWRPHYGAPTGESRDYYVAPRLFELRAATCIDIACYDAAAIRVFQKRDAWPVIKPTATPREFHAWVRIDGLLVDHVSLYYGG